MNRRLKIKDEINIKDFADKFGFDTRFHEIKKLSKDVSCCLWGRNIFLDTKTGNVNEYCLSFLYDIIMSGMVEVVEDEQD